MNEWLWAATVLTTGLIALGVVVVSRRAIDGVVALQAAGADAALILLLVAEGTRRQSFVDLALVLCLLSFAGSLVFLRYLERRPA